MSRIETSDTKQKELGSSVGRSRQSPWSWFLGRLLGVEVYLHTSLTFLLAWVAFSTISSGGDPLFEVFFVVALLTSVLAHEFGHVLMARLFSIPTRDITLYPFGGVATLRGDLYPKAEFFISLAGPAVSFVLGLLIFLGAIAFNLITWNSLLQETATPNAAHFFALRLAIANMMLCFFNLLPALPMDGGRTLRAVLALLGMRSATTVAVRISQGLCLILGLIAAFSGNVILTLIAGFVFMGSVKELMHSRTVLSAEGQQATDVMTERAKLLTLPHGASITGALHYALKSLQPFFPVMVGDQLLGIVPRQAIIEAATVGQADGYVSGIMIRDYQTVPPTESLTGLLTRYQEGLVDPVVVVDQINGSEKMMGIICQDQLLEFLMVQGIRKQRSQQPVDEDLPF